MAKKKRKLNKTERREVRLRKARQWVLTYEGSHIVRAYRKRFKVDPTCALADLGEIGALQPEKLAIMKQNEEIRLQKRREEREARREQEFYEQFPNSDDRFFYIVGYTSGGAPYGTTWEEIGLEPYQTLEDMPAQTSGPGPAQEPRLTPVLFSELDDEQKAEVIERLEELIDDFFLGADYIPDDEDRAEILAELCKDMSECLNPWEPADSEPETQIELLTDDALKAALNGIVARIVAELKEDGIELPTFMDTLLVAETDRLKIRRFYKTDLNALWKIMSKPEVMYAWEEGFKKSETRKWLNRQYTRYHKDGYGYYAVTLKDSGRLIGQAGLMKSEVNGENVVEIGYIFDDAVWGWGYAIEAVRACVDLAFHQFGLDRLYATIRPENAASVRLAEKLGMRKTGEYVKTYKDKEMPHDIFVLKEPKEGPQ